MSRSRFWRGTKNYRPVTLLQQLEERIVLDAAVNPAPQDNPNDHPASQTDPSHAADAATAGDHAPAAADSAGGHTDANAGLAATAPDSYNQAFHKDLNVVLVANNLADVKAVSDAAATADAKVIVFDAATDNLASVTAKLQDVVNSTGHKIDNLAIVGHGSAGVLSIGVDDIQLFSLGNYKPTFEVLGQTLSENAQIQFYGCSLAGNALGEAMVQSIAVYTAADTFASTDTTGGNAHDWTLEYSSNSSVAMHTILNTDALASDITPLADAMLVKDIDTSSTSYSAGYAVGSGALAGKVYFSAADGISSTDSYGEPWVYDSATGTAALLKDIRPLYSSQPQYFTVSGGKLFFSATDGTNGTELWVSDGIAGGDTHMVGSATGLAAGAGSSTPTQLVDVGGTLYFLANDGSGQTLWKTDGTTSVEVGVTNNPLSVSSIGSLTNVNGKLYFVGTNATYGGAEVYTVDNATGNIGLAANINTAAGTGSSPTALTAVGSSLYLVANDGGGNAIHQITGTTDTKITNSLTITAFANLTNVNGTLFFAGTTAASGQELYKVAGGAELLVQNINPNGTTGGNPASLTAVGSTLYFTANDGTGLTLWQSDGTTTGKVPNLTGNDAVTSFSNLKNIGGKLYFTGSSLSTGSELYKVEAGNIALAQDIYPGATPPPANVAYSSSPTALTDIGGGKMIFTANNGFTGNEPWVYDGTSPATSLDINHLGGSPQWLTNVNGTLYFASSDGAHGLELWKSDPATGATTMVADLNPGTAAGVVPYGGTAPMVNVNGTLFFIGSTSTGTDGALYKIDNATGLPALVKNVVPGTEWLINLTAFENTLYFSNYSAGMYWVWRSDGTDAGTVAVTDPSGAQIRGAAAPYFTNVNGTLYFQGGQNGFSPDGAELYKIDANGKMVMVQDLNGAPGSYQGSSPSYLTNVGGTLYFTATVGTTTSLYSYDGVNAIAQVPNGIVGAPAVTGMGNLTNVNGTLFFTGTATGYGTELFYVDGQGTIQVVDAIIGATGISPTNLYNANGTLMFAATDTTNGQELWSYTIANGASMIKDINLGTSGSSPSLFTYLDGLTYFKATTAANGVELWQTNGTLDGTVMIGTAGSPDIYPGVNGSNPANLTAVNNTLFFAASAPGIGTELYKVDGPGSNTVPTVNAFMNQTHTFDEDTLNFNLQDIVIADTAGDPITATLALSNAAAGSLSNNNGASYNTATGFWSVSGTFDQVNLALQNVTFTPTLDWNGTVNITTHVQDLHATGPVNGQITLNVTAVNDAPVTTDLNLTVDEDNLLTVSGWTFNDIKDQVVGGSVANTAVSVNIADLPLNGTLFYDNGTTNDALIGSTDILWADVIAGKVTFQPGADWNGSTSFHFTVKDNGGTTPGVDTSALALAALTVNPVNDAPVTNGLPGVLTVTQSDPASPYQINPITFSSTPGAQNQIIISDVDLTVGQSTTPTALYSVDLSTVNGGIATGNITVVDTGAGIITGVNDGTATALTLTGTLDQINAALNGMSFIPFADSTVANHAYSGTAPNAYLTIVTHDNGNIGPLPVDGNATTDIIDFVVNPVAHTPVNNLGQFNGVPAGSLVSLANNINVHDGDLNDTLFVSVSAGTGVSGIGWGAQPATAPQFTFVGQESYFDTTHIFDNLTAQLQAGFYGQASVLVSSTDIAGHTITSAIPINVATPQLPPQITTNVAGFTVNEDNDGLGSVSLGTHVSVSDPNGDPLSVDLAASAGWSTLNASGPATVTGGGSTALHITGTMADVQATLATLNGTLIPNFNGTASLNVTAMDNIPGNTPTTALVDVPVIAVNDAPGLIVPGAQIGGANTPLALTGISVADLDVNETAPLNNVIYMQLDAANGTLSLANTNGLTFDAGHGNGTGSVWFTGNLTQLGNALATVTYTPGLNYNGLDAVSVSANDMGHTGQPGSLVATGTIDLNIGNVPPQLTIGTIGAVSEDPGVAVNLAQAVTVSDLNGDALTVTLTVSNGWSDLTATPSSPGVSVNWDGINQALTISGPLADLQTTLASLTGTLNTNFNGTASFSVTATDNVPGNIPATGQVDVSVTPVNDAPVAVVDAYTVTQDGVLNVPAAGVLANDTDVDSPTLTAVLGATLPTHGALTLNPDGSFAYTPTAGYTGPDSFTYMANDGSANSNEVAVSIDVGLAANQAPVNTVPIAVQGVDPSGAVTFSAANGNLISVSDVDAGTGLIKVTLTATHGTMTLNGAMTGLSFDPALGGQGDGTADAAMTFLGTVTDINNALNGMKFTHDAGFYGMADVTINVNDQGNTGPGGALSSAQGVANISVEPFDSWFHGFGTESGWEVYNDAGTRISYYTHDYTVLWQHVNSTNTWNFFNGTDWVGTNDLGNAPYADGYGPFGQWFPDNVTGGTYNGYEVYIHANGVTEFSLDHTAPGAQYWQVTGAGAWTYYDGSAWYSTAGFNVGPDNVWYHGFGTDAGWNVYNHSATSISYYTHDYVSLWQHVTSTNTWNFFDGSAWYATTGLNVGPVDVWYHGFGTYAGWEVYNHAATNISYYTHTYVTLWQHVTATDAWNYFDGTVWTPTTGLGVIV